MGNGHRGSHHRSVYEGSHNFLFLWLPRPAGFKVYDMYYDDGWDQMEDLDKTPKPTPEGWLFRARMVFV
jgi:hypothetical protein